MSPKALSFTLLLLGTSMLAITSSNTLFVWAMMELNMLTFMPIISTKTTTETEACIKYLIPQTLGSNLFIASTLLFTTTNFSKLVASVALLLKLGSVPLHGWLASVMRSINLMAGFTLLTWQKITPLFLLTTQQLGHTPVIITSAIMSALWGSIAGLNQTNILTLMAFSSIAHLGWLLVSSALSLLITFVYLLSYTLTLLPITLHMQTSSTKTHNTLMPSLPTNKHQQTTSILSLLSLASLPPLAMFSTKVLVVSLMIQTHMTTPLTPLLLSSLISLYFYLTLTLTLTTNLSKSTQHFVTKSHPAMTATCVSLSMFQILALPAMALYTLTP